MIQRIQSLYLFLTILLSTLFLSGDYLMFINSSGAHAGLGITGLTGFPSPGFNGLVWYIVTVAVAAAAGLALFSIFLFRKRILQTRLTVYSGVLTLLAAIAMAAFIFSAISEQAKPLFCFRSVLPLLNLVLLFLAYRSIRKDEDLVKSLDRLR